MRQLTQKQRLRHYSMLAGIAIAVPALLVVVCGVITWSRASGLGMAIIPSNFFVHFIFGLLFFRHEADNKYAIAILVGFFSVFLFFPLLFFIPVLHSFWATVILGYVIYIVLSALLWEVVYRILQGVYRIKNKTEL